MSKLKLAVSPYGNAWGKFEPFDEVFDEFFNPLVLGTLKGADGLLLWGGEDIHPSFYGQKPHPQNECKSVTPSHRDMIEWHLLREAYTQDIPIFGVCRGAQMLCCFAGGSLIQHTTNHLHAHEIKTKEGLSMQAAANHHQMMEPSNARYDLLAWREAVANTRYEGVDANGNVVEIKHGDCIVDGIDPEVVWFPDVRGLAIQPHPEWMDRKSEFSQWIVNQILTYPFGD
jgi:putative glutamine amidotransferase